MRVTNEIPCGNIWALFPQIKFSWKYFYLLPLIKNLELERGRRNFYLLHSDGLKGVNNSLCLENYKQEKSKGVKFAPHKALIARKMREKRVITTLMNSFNISFEYTWGIFFSSSSRKGIFQWFTFLFLK